MGNWLNTLDPVANNVEDLWDQFLEAYAYQFQDSQATQWAWTELKNCRMTNNDYDDYISHFEALTDKAEYTRGSAEMYNTRFCPCLQHRLLTQVLTHHTCSIGLHLVGGYTPKPLLSLYGPNIYVYIFIALQ